MKSVLTFLFFASVLLSSCGDKQPEKATNKEGKSTTEEKESTSSKNASKQKTSKKATLEYPTLTNKSVVPFLKKYGKANKETLVELSCRFGNIKIRLYENTPLHRANFIYLTKRKYFDETQFYRVADGFVCQAGNSDEWETQYTRKDIGMYTLPNEINKVNIHKTGAIASARGYDNNPDKLSSPYEFYITLGPKYNRKTVLAIAKEEGVTYTDEQVDTYVKLGGQPSLDQQHTVFGEVIEGMDVVYEINKVKVDSREWPHDVVPIKVKVLK